MSNNTKRKNGLLPGIRIWLREMINYRDSYSVEYLPRKAEISEIKIRIDDEKELVEAVGSCTIRALKTGALVEMNMRRQFVGDELEHISSYMITQSEDIITLKLNPKVREVGEMSYVKKIKIDFVVENKNPPKPRKERKRKGELF